MRKQKSTGNKGFSLVELIIVIAIMAILVGVLAPQLLRYVEKANVSADVQLADAVRSAVTTAMLDPSVINAGDTSAADIAAFSAVGGAYLSTINSTGTVFADSVWLTLGLATSTEAAVVNEFRSNVSGTARVHVLISGTNLVTVTLEGTDESGSKHTNATVIPIRVPQTGAASPSATP